MELPADPKNLLYGVYGKHGEDLTKEDDEMEKKAAFWALADEEEWKPMKETPYDIVSYSMWG